MLALLVLGGEVIWPFAAGDDDRDRGRQLFDVYIAAPIMLLLSDRKKAAESKPAPKAKSSKKAKARA